MNAIDGVGRRQLVDRGHGENRLADVQRFHRQAALAHAAGDDALAEIGALDDGRQIVGGENRLHARHGERRTRIDTCHAGVRSRAEQELGEQHAVGAEVLGVFGAAGDFRDQVGRRVVLAD